MEYDDDYEFEWEDLGPSKSSLKRDARHAVEVGKQLVEAPASTLRKLLLPDDVRKAVKDAQQIHAHGARKRQLLFLGKLLRNEELEPIEEALRRIACGLPLENEPVEPVVAETPAWQQWLQTLQESGGDAIEALLQAHPELFERSRLRQLLRNIEKKPQDTKTRQALADYLRESLR